MLVLMGLCLCFLMENMLVTAQTLQEEQELLNSLQELAAQIKLVIPELSGFVELLKELVATLIASTPNPREYFLLLKSIFKT